MNTKELPYTVDEMQGLLWLWSSELSEIANAINGAGLDPEQAVKTTPEITAVMKLKLKRVSREVGEMLESIEGKNVKAS